MKNICKIYALSGGPTVGKSTVIQLLKEWVNHDSGIFIDFLDETASSIFFQDIDEELLRKYDRVLRQIHIFHTQRKREDEVASIVKAVHVPTLIITDRGLNDVFGYCSTDEVERYFTSEEKSLLTNRYDAVFHLEAGTPDEIRRRLRSNPARQETSVSEVIGSCEKTAQAWLPYYPDAYRIGQYQTAEEKAKILAQTLNTVYGKDVFHY